MILLLICVLMVVFTLGYALAPIFFNTKSASSNNLGEENPSLAQAVEFYKERETALSALVTKGEINAAEKDAFLAEQARALLMLDQASKRGQVPLEEPKPSVGFSIFSGFYTFLQLTSSPKTSTRKPVIALVFLALMGSVALYLKLGSPDFEDFPLASREPPQAVDMQTALRKVEEHLKKNPKDLRGYEVIAPAYMRMGRYQEAIAAYQRVLALAGENAERLTNLAESMIAAADGQVNHESVEILTKARQLDPTYTKAGFYLALSFEQAGDAPRALAALRTLAQDLPQGAARLRVEQEIARLDPNAPPPASPPDVAAPDIGAMVERLDQRLQAQGGNVEEWGRLVRAYHVLGQIETALLRLDAAEKALKEGKMPLGSREYAKVQQEIDSLREKMLEEQKARSSPSSPAVNAPAAAPPFETNQKEGAVR